MCSGSLQNFRQTRRTETSHTWYLFFVKTPNSPIQQAREITYHLICFLIAEARKRKTRNWEEQDFYDSDDDNFLDRTGSVEKKREHRMRQAGKFQQKVETYASLVSLSYFLADDINLFMILWLPFTR